MDNELVITTWDYGGLSPVQALRSVARVLDRDFGDISVETRRRNISALEKKMGQVLGHFEDWTSGRRYDLDMNLNVHSASVKVTMRDS